MRKSAHKRLASSMPKGFTLIELLVVIAIVGVLAAVVLIAINPAVRLAQGRDAGRKSDIGQIATAMQAYYTTNSRYPTTLNELTTSGDLKIVPTDPGGGSYSLTYNTTDTSEGAVHATLEAPTSGSGFNADTAVWCYRTSTGGAAELTASSVCTAN